MNLNAIVRCFALILVIGCVALPPQAKSLASVLPSGLLKGSFEEIRVGRPCGNIDDISESLALGSITTEPLFVARIDANGLCDESIATVRSGKIMAITTVPGIFINSRVAAAPNGTIWATSGMQYVTINASGSLSYANALSAGYKPVSVGIDSDGTVYGLESAGDNSEGPARLVDVNDAVSYSVASGYVQSLVRGNDGHLYFKREMPRSCEIYEVLPHEPPLARTSCIESANQQMAIDRSGAIWQANFLGVQRTPRAGNLEDFGPIEAPPSDVYCVVCYFPRSVVVQGDDSVWFVYSNRLWRLDPRRVLSSVALPVREPASAMIGTTDGNLWIATGLASFEQPGTLLRFSPADR